MNPALNQKQDSIMDLTGDESAKQSSFDQCQKISTSYEPFDPILYFESPPLDDIIFQDHKGYESRFPGHEHDSINSAMSFPSTYPTSTTGMSAAAGQDLPFRTRIDPEVPQPMGTISFQSTTNLFNELCPSSNQGHADIGFVQSKEMDKGAGTQIQSVRNSQLEKRRAQNRNSQRAFRERKESYTNHLERELQCLQEKYDTAMRCLTRLRASYAAIESLDRFDLTFSERGMGIVIEELKKDSESETYGAGEQYS